MLKMECMWYLFSVLTLITNCHGILSPEEFMKTAFTIKSTEEFFDKYVRWNGTRINITHLQGESGESGEKMLVGGEEIMMAEYDPCTPRPATQLFGGENPDPYVMYWPPCTRTKKCGGCCTNSMMTCVPTRISTTPVQTAKTRLPSPGSPFFEFIGMDTELVEEHLACEPRCTVQPSDCNMLQEFSELDCKCVCLNYQSCESRDHYYDDTRCQCRCISRMDCVGAHTIFDERACRCRMMTIHEINEVLLAGGLTFEEIQAMNRVASTSITDPTTTTPQPTTTEATTTTTTSQPSTTTTTEATTTTTTQTTTANPTTTTPTTTTRPLSPEEICERKPCQANQSPVLLSNGICHCMLNFNSFSLHNLVGLRYRRELVRRWKAGRPYH
ncbi:integumentary mucin C.1-like [Pecten maximus]|uniref:integumentary mucin C.1-like n=1 Tax=Pecten maximus TaxID=6579 RepID=UPI001458A443|nr:integumentary mucin C.1-like [Pecten maximus]